MPALTICSPDDHMNYCDGHVVPRPQLLPSAVEFVPDGNPVARKLPMTVSSRATERSHFARYRAELVFSAPSQASIGAGGPRLGAESLEARRLHLRETLLGLPRISGIVPVPR